MSIIPVKQTHPLWGRALPEYLDSYSIEATCVHGPPDPSQSASMGAQIGKTINEIVTLGDVGFQSNVPFSITLSMLENTLQVLNVPGQLDRLADPRVIAGCVSLMAAMDLSPFQYEYGYISFRILVLALNCCLLKHIGELSHVISRMNTVPSPLRLPMFWTDSAHIISSELEGAKRLSNISGSGLFSEYKLDRLLDLLHADQKNLLMVLKTTKSLGLSGLMFVFWKHIEVERVTRNNPVRLLQELVQPFSRILWRYLLAIPNIKPESEAVLLIHNQIAPIAQFGDKRFIDLEDSRYILQALIDRLAATSPMMIGESATLLRFAEPLVVPGCEDLIPHIIWLSIEVMWYSMVHQPAHVVRFAVGSHLLYFRAIFKRLRSRYGPDQPWTARVVDNIIQGDLVDLILRSMLTATEFNPDSDNTETKLFSASVETFVELAKVFSGPQIALRLHESGKLADWFKYTGHFFDVGSLIEEFSNKYNFDCINKVCGQLLYGIMAALVGEKGMQLLRPVGGSCDNPRCPVPFNATLSCSRCEDLIYCSSWCLSTDWVGAWGGPHQRVCKAQSKKDPASRLSYHSFIGLPSSLYEDAQRDGASAPQLAEFVLNTVRQQTGQPHF